MIGVNSITNEEELKAFVTAVAPYFYKYLASQSKNIFDCEVATSIENIKTMPALYDDGNGVRKQVVAPLQLLTKDVDVQIAAAKDAASKANASSQEADTAANSANAAAKKVTDAITDITQEKQAALDAAASANSEAAKAKTATINATSATASANDAAASANAQAASAQAAAKAANDAAATSQTQTAACKVQTDRSKELNDHPTIQGDNGNWWKWDEATKAYIDTHKIAKGGMMYPSFIFKRNRLYVRDNSSLIAERVRLRRNKLYIKI